MAEPGAINGEGVGVAEVSMVMGGVDDVAGRGDKVSMMVAVVRDEEVSGIVVSIVLV